MTLADLNQWTKDQLLRLVVWELLNGTYSEELEHKKEALINAGARWRGEEIICPEQSPSPST